MVGIKSLYKILLTFDATIIFIFLYLVKNEIWILDDWILSIFIYIIGILILSAFCLKVRFILKCSNIEGGIISISLANDNYMPTYLGYFFVALSLPKDTHLFLIVYLIIFIFTIESQVLFYNPLFLIFGYNFYYIRDQKGMEVFVISKKKGIRDSKEVYFNKMKKINDFTFIDEDK